MGDWNLNEFKELCLNSGFERALFYVESLAFKYHATLYHKDKIQQKINESPESSPNKLAAYDFEIAFEIDALMLALNSMWDVLAQLLNECFIHLNVGDVYFNKVSDSKEYCFRSLPTEIQTILKSIKESVLYRTIKDYANVSKHRHAIKGDIIIDFRETPTKASYKTKEFRHNKGQRYKLTPEKVFQCLEFVGKSVDQIGAEIHKSIEHGVKPNRL